MTVARALSVVLCAAAIGGCAFEAAGPSSVATADPVEPPPDASAATETAAHTTATWPTEAQFGETAAALPNPWTLTRVSAGSGEPMLALARKNAGGEWELGALFGPYELPAGCEALPCAWPASLAPETPLAEAPALPADLLQTVAYTRTLLAFEGPLDVMDEPDDGAWMSELPETTWSDPMSADLAPYLERLRRHHPMGMCSMDSRPMVVAQMRARAAAQAGRTGWAVQGWLDTVGYWSSPRTAWSSYGQSHPTDHLQLLEMVNVDPERAMLGALISLPDHPTRLYLADARRVAPDLGPGFVERLRELAANPRLDPYNRALLFATYAELPFADAPGYDALPPRSQELLAFWSR